MNPQDIQNYIDSQIQAKLPALVEERFQQLIRNTGGVVIDHHHNNIDSPTIDLNNFQLLHANYMTVTCLTNGTTAVDIFGNNTFYPFTILSAAVICNDATAGNITIKNGTSTVATIAKGIVAGVMTGASSLSNTLVGRNTLFTAVSSSAGNAFVIINFKI
jgi:hypothetical protein